MDTSFMSVPLSAGGAAAATASPSAARASASLPADLPITSASSLISSGTFAAPPPAVDTSSVSSPGGASGTGAGAAAGGPGFRFPKVRMDSIVDNRGVQAALAAAKKSKTALDSLAKDENANVHSSLQSNQFSILDVYSSDSNELELAVSLREREKQEQSLLRRSRDLTLLQRLRERIKHFTSAPSSWIFLVLLGLISAVVAYLIEAPTDALLELRAHAIQEYGGAAYVIWVLWAMAFTLLSAVVCHWMPMAEGSGIPQMKAILAGTDLSQYLSIRVASAKLVSLVGALTAGLSIGREGPYVHLASCIAAKLMRVPYFSHIRNNESMRRQMLAAGISAGVVATFGTPVGSVLFSIEVTSTYFMVNSFWRCFLCAIITRFAFEILTVLKQDSTFNTTSFTQSDLSAQIIGYALLGAICGLMGSFFVFCVNRVRIIRKKVMTSSKRRYLLVLVVAALTASLTFSTSYLQGGDRTVINAMFADNAVESNTLLADWMSPSLFASLCLFIFVKFLTTVACISLPISCGLFIPLFSMGAVTGRLVGEVLKLMWPDSIVPGAYAVVGAAAMVSGATQTVSTAVILFELTGQTSHILPITLATLVAYSVSGIFTISIYDMLLLLAGLPYLPRVYSSEIYDKAARDIMHTDMRVLSLNSTYGEAKALLEAPPYTVGNSVGSAYSQKIMQFAVVDSPQNMMLVGSVSRVELERVLQWRRDWEAARWPGGRRDQRASSAVSLSAHPIIRMGSGANTGSAGAATSGLSSGAGGARAGRGEERSFSAEDSEDEEQMTLSITSSGNGSRGGYGSTSSTSSAAARSERTPLRPSSRDGSSRDGLSPRLLVSVEMQQSSGASATAAYAPPGLGLQMQEEVKMLDQSASTGSAASVLSTPSLKAAGSSSGAAAAVTEGALSASTPSYSVAPLGSLPTYYPSPSRSSSGPSIPRASSGNAVLDAARNAGGYIVSLFKKEHILSDAAYSTEWLQQPISFANVRRRSPSSLSMDAALGSAAASSSAVLMGGVSSVAAGAAAATGGVSFAGEGVGLLRPRNPSSSSAEEEAQLDSLLQLPQQHSGLPSVHRAEEVRLDPAPFSVADLTPLPKVHYLFAICLFGELLVVREGRLVGTILKEDLSNVKRLSSERLTSPSAAAMGGSAELEE